MSVSKFLAYKQEDQRLVMLRLMDEAGPSLNESLLHEGLRRFGHKDLMREEVQDHIRFLEKAQTVTIQVESGKLIADITVFGKKVARGKETVDGIAEPGRD